MNPFAIYLCGVGGQGIGLLSEILLRAADYAGYVAKAVDTHGLAQRGGVVVSHIRLGETVHTPLIPAYGADLVVGLERHEALRGAQAMLRDGGALVYFDTVLQPLGVRLGTEAEITNADVDRACASRGIAVHRMTCPNLADPRMQNIVVLGHLHLLGLVGEVTAEHSLRAMDDLLEGPVLAANVGLFRSIAATARQAP
ncbi:2-oxoacid:acceptor oxidoreductase family protein [Desulfobulbus sp.]|uniref:2-oxoacid:acceptor oxidoreductase family protein n=1 Tax=Desulfobulbus sp. TaxID=895 RepID=UPI00286F1A48|nr:2-oxoacid:acceptor oxidoreductase family protein [Desulfobulbus sp.]